jgi:hypothetical protein
MSVSMTLKVSGFFSAFITRHDSNRCSSVEHSIAHKFAYSNVHYTHMKLGCYLTYMP